MNETNEGRHVFYANALDQNWRSAVNAADDPPNRDLGIDNRRDDDARLVAEALGKVVNTEVEARGLMGRAAQDAYAAEFSRRAQLLVRAGIDVQGFRAGPPGDFYSKESR